MKSNTPVQHVAKPCGYVIALLLMLMFVGSAMAIEADTNIRLDPHPDHIGYYVNSTYITCNFTNQESANTTIKFERYNTSTNASDVVTDFGEFAVNQTAHFNITATNYSTVGWYRAAMYDIDGNDLCMYWISVRSNTSGNYEQLFGSMRFSDADSTPTISFIENIAGRAQTWTTDSISLTHSIVLWGFNGSEWSSAAGGNYSELDHTKTSGNLTNWVLPYTPTLGNYSAMILYSHDAEVLDVHFVEAVVPESNVVEIIARDAETNEQIMTYTATMIDITKTASSGKVIWTNVTNGEHLITVQAENYQTGTATIYMANSYINSTVYLLRYSPYTAPHYVKFKVLSVFGGVYQNIHTDVSYTAASGENASMNGTTGSDGAVTFLMTPSIQYTLTFINATQGISETLTIYPKDTEYYIYIDSFSWTPPENQTIRDTVDWGWTSERINTTHGWINFTYTDTSNETTHIDYWINASNDTNLYSFNTTYPTSWTVNQTVEADNKTYIVHFSADHPRFGSLVGSVRHTITFMGMRFGFGWDEQWMYDTVAICAIIFIGLLFSATSVNVGAVVCALSGWMFMWIGWLSGSTANYGMMVLATIIAVGFAMRKGETMKA